MQGSGKTYEVSGEMNEWEDILIKKGITTKYDVLMKKGVNPEDFLSDDEEEDVDHEAVETLELEKTVSGMTMNQLDELEDECDEDDDKILEHYREKRLAELKMQRLRDKFGEVVEIAKVDWIREVTDASKACWVVVHLYQDSKVECRLMDNALANLAPRFPAVKFLKIRSSQAVENWPDHNLPSLFLYHDGELQHQSMTLRHLQGKTMKPSDLEWWLVQKDVLTGSELEEDPRLANPDNKPSVTKVSSPSSVFRAASHRNRLNLSDDEEDDTIDRDSD